MRELVEVIAKSLVDYPDQVVVTQKETEKAIVIELRVAQSDMGKVIGKQGRIAKAIRAVVQAATSKVEKKVVVEIMQQITIQSQGNLQKRESHTCMNEFFSVNCFSEKPSQGNT